ncbi:hypothetical protein KK473_27930, partial [Klebsiella pneumoniae]|uniref:hypothetical protein n=1 Tax=Klebsiella pneumoniae TaxID=573 RepID=UPI001BDFA402
EEVNHVTTGGHHFKSTYLESDNPLGELERPQHIEVQEEEEEILKQLKHTQANITIWGLLMASQKHRQTILRLLNQV